MSGMPEFMAAEVIGQRIIETADRLITADKVVPGTTANLSFVLDDIEFSVEMKVSRKKGRTGTNA